MQSPPKDTIFLKLIVRLWLLLAPHKHKHKVNICPNNAPPHDKDSFHYRCIIGKINYLEKSTQPDISYATHQCAHFSANPKQPHANTVKWLGRYLKGTKDKGMILKPSGTSFNVYIDADFAGNWKQSEVDSRDTAHS